MQTVSQTQFNRARLACASTPFDISNFSGVDCASHSDASMKLMTTYRDDAQLVAWFQNQANESSVVTIDGIRYTIFTVGSANGAHVVRKFRLLTERNSPTKVFVVMDGVVIHTGTTEPVAHDEPRGDLCGFGFEMPFPLFLVKDRTIQVWVTTPLVSSESSPPVPFQLRYVGGVLPTLTLNSFLNGGQTLAPTTLTREPPCPRGTNPLLGLFNQRPDTMNLPAPTSTASFLLALVQLGMSYITSTRGGNDSRAPPTTGCNRDTCPFNNDTHDLVYSVSPYMCLIDARTGTNLVTTDVTDQFYPDEPSLTNLSQVEVTETPTVVPAARSLCRFVNLATMQITTQQPVAASEETKTPLAHRAIFNIRRLNGNELSNFTLSNTQDVTSVSLEMNDIPIWGFENTNRESTIKVGYANPLPFPSSARVRYTVVVQTTSTTPVTLVYNTSESDSSIPPFMALFVDNYGLRIQNNFVSVVNNTGDMPDLVDF